MGICTLATRLPRPNTQTSIARVPVSCLPAGLARSLFRDPAPRTYTTASVPSPLGPRWLLVVASRSFRVAARPARPGPRAHAHAVVPPPRWCDADRDGKGEHKIPLIIGGTTIGDVAYHPRHQNVFTLRTGRETLMLSASSAAQKERWTRALLAATTPPKPESQGFMQVQKKPKGFMQLQGKQKRNAHRGRALLRASLHGFMVRPQHN